MHAYDVPRRQSYQPISPGRAAQDPSAGASATPIYDELYAEYIRAFRACPGDRSGEEELGFVAFSLSSHDTGSYGTGTYGTGTYGTGAYGTRHGTPQHATGHLTSQHGQSATTIWQQVARQARGMHPVPALPPAPRRGL
ncbi:hypothetical protein [Streptomyces glomeratus]|uniref:hypothetical protein n=1 Tax=Streptomyces glomeratus TaxID=284452 RepID=UPI001F379689|nr:hypothetical protein [Streptomyces glomeratus]MCF1510568.1 hypothetical protein [Streptomyces glomeratus]